MRFIQHFGPIALWLVACFALAIPAIAQAGDDDLLGDAKKASNEVKNTPLDTESFVDLPLDLKAKVLMLNDALRKNRCGIAAPIAANIHQKMGTSESQTSRAMALVKVCQDDLIGAWQYFVEYRERGGDESIIAEEVSKVEASLGFYTVRIEPTGSWIPDNFHTGLSLKEKSDKGYFSSDLPGEFQAILLTGTRTVILSHNGQVFAPISKTFKVAAGPQQDLVLAPKVQVSELTVRVEPPGMAAKTRIVVTNLKTLTGAMPADNEGNESKFILGPGEYSIESGISDPLYTVVKKKEVIRVAAGPGNRHTVELKALPSSTLTVPNFHPDLKVKVTLPTGFVLYANPDSQHIVGAGHARVDVQLRDESLVHTFVIPEGWATLPLPTAAVFKANNDPLKTVLIPVQTDDGKGQDSIAVPVPDSKEGETFKVATNRSLKPGDLQKVEVTAERFAPVSHYQSWQTAKSDVTKARLLTVAAGALAGGVAGLGRSYVVAAQSTAEEARDFSDPSDESEYRSLSDEANELALSANTILAGSGVGFALTGALVYRSSRKRKKASAAQSRFSESANVPVPIDGVSN